MLILVNYCPVFIKEHLMIRKTYLYENEVWNEDLDASLNSKNTLVICFGNSEYSLINSAFDDVFKTYDNSIIVGCSTAGEIYQDELYEESLSIAVIKFEKSQIRFESSLLNDASESFDVGFDIAKKLCMDNLKGIFVLSDGLDVNGSQLTKGINADLTCEDIIVTGGLAGDDARFEKTWVLLDNKPVSNYVTAVGFYGDDVTIAHGSKGGWSQFGINRMVTESKANVLYKLDHKPALEVYKTYLGNSAKDLPSSGLLYPLMIKEDDDVESKVRTILAINEQDQSITFAGDIPTGSEVMFMKASFAQLIEGANGASKSALIQEHNKEEAINIAISCVGRKLVLGQRTEDEIEAVLDNLDESVLQVGYYSYGEISPLASGKCDLHNQTMTLTLIWES